MLHNAMDNTLLTLNCLVDGDAAADAFPVEIESTKTIGNLKQRIMAENSNTFIGIDAKDLALWRVSIPVDDDDDEDEHPILLDEVSVKKKLKGTSKLNVALKYKPENPDLPDDTDMSGDTDMSDAIILLEDTIHIIVRRPPPGNVDALALIHTSRMSLLLCSNLISHLQLHSSSPCTCPYPSLHSTTQVCSE
jgi:hypothetical protein